MPAAQLIRALAYLLLNVVQIVQLVQSSGYTMRRAARRGARA